ncbi:MAG: hypothetical protein SOY73_15625 [Blautia sp.]|nr:hypothetical protein [Blautia sp.]
MEKEGTVSESTEETESMKEESYPSVFLNRNPSKDLKKLRGKGRSFQANKNEQ